MRLRDPARGPGRRVSLKSGIGHQVVQSVLLAFRFCRAAIFVSSASWGSGRIVQFFMRLELGMVAIAMSFLCLGVVRARYEMQG